MPTIGTVIHLDARPYRVYDIKWTMLAVEDTDNFADMKVDVFLDASQSAEDQALQDMLYSYGRHV